MSALPSEQWGLTSLPKRLHQFFEQSADRNPQKVAIICDEETLSYQELEERANQLAHYLRHHRIGKGHRVGILLQRSFDTYICLLGIHKAGAAFVPMDVSFPKERVDYIANDAALSLILTSSSLADTYGDLCCPVVALDLVRADIAGHPRTRIDLTNSRSSFDRAEDVPLSHLIYTSGSTGNPKGVAISQANICNLIPALRQSWAIRREDRVYQGMTIAFDFAHEEIWPGLDAGATLIAGPNDGRRVGPDLVDFLLQHRITVFSCVPSLLATLDKDIPTLRLLMVGGEHCPSHLVVKWAKTGRRMLNTYGPTEATCNAASGELLPGKKVTLGKPLPSYRLYVLNEQLQPVRAGETGEIHIGGPGVALGYVNLPELTKEKFIPDPFDWSGQGGRLYKTGDLGRLLADDDIEFLGRIDSQIKLRGYRIELAEIEAAVLEDPRIENAVVSLWAFSDTQKDLVAYVKPRAGAPANVELIVKRLRRRLPAYMIPRYVEVLTRLPRLPNGKIDRKNLPAPSAPLSCKDLLVVPARTDLEKKLARIWQDLFALDQVSIDADFFNDLGGHSLLAASAVSRLRQEGINADIGIDDIYCEPTIRGLALLLDNRHVGLGDRIRDKHGLPFHQATSAKVALCGFAQAASLLLLSFGTIALYTAFYDWCLERQVFVFSNGEWKGMLALLLATTLLLWFSVPVLGKWLLLGRLKEGNYPLWGFFYFRWWLAGRLAAASPLGLLSGSPFMAPYCRLFGMKIGAHCHLASSFFYAPDLLHLGNRVSINQAAHLAGYKIADGYLRLGPITIGDDCTIGCNALVELNSRMEPGTGLGDQSCLQEGDTIPQGQYWCGSPARSGDVPDNYHDVIDNGKEAPRLLLGIGFLVAVTGIALLPLAIGLPSMVLLLGALYLKGWLTAFTLLPLAGITWVFMTCLVIVLAKKLILSRLNPGIYPVRSALYLRKWIIDYLLKLSQGLTHTLYSTLYLAPFLRALGVKIGTFAEISTVANITPALLEIGSFSFIADQASAGTSLVHRGSIQLQQTQIGERSFVGNAAHLPGGTYLNNECLVGVLSVPPKTMPQPGTSWFGSPALYLPKRQPSKNFDQTLTYYPTLGLVLKRLGIEFFRVFLPPILYCAFLLFFIACFFYWPTRLPVLEAACYLTLAGWGSILAMTGFVILLKWLLMGHYRPRTEPLWSHFVWRTELITGLYEGIIVPTLLNPLLGTLFAAWCLRLLGASIGRRVLLETSYLTEFDLVQVGDDSAIGPMASLQTHLFEDRVMKMDQVTIGARASIGRRSIILYSSHLQNGGKLEPLSLLMKGETLEAGRRYRGIPSRPALPAQPNGRIK